jgi:hypothetical protein
MSSVLPLGTFTYLNQDRLDGARISSVPLKARAQTRGSVAKTAVGAGDILSSTRAADHVVPVVGPASLMLRVLVVESLTTDSALRTSSLNTHEARLATINVAVIRTNPGAGRSSLPAALEQVAFALDAGAGEGDAVLIYFSISDRIVGDLDIVDSKVR